MARRAQKILLVGFPEETRTQLGQALAAAGPEPPELVAAPSWAEATPLLARAQPGLVLLDLGGPAGLGPEACLQVLREAPHLPLLVLVDPGQGDLALEACRAGAQETLTTADLARPEVLALSLEQARLRHSEQLHRSIVENQTALICRFLPDGTITFANEAFRRYFRWSQDELPGRRNLFARQSPQERQRSLAQLRTLTPEHPLARIEKPFTTKLGEERWQQWTNWAFFDRQGGLLEYQSVGQDITERKRMEEALQVVEANLRSLIISNADGMIVVDAQGLVRFANPAAEQMLGRRAFELVGRSFEFALDPGERQEVQLVRGQGGGDLVAEIRVVKTKWQEEPAYLASLRDITELARLREQLRSLSLVDQLTGLFNRRGFVTVAEQQLKTAHRMNRKMRLFFLDLDDLKTINDNLGHRLGDQALLASAGVLRATFRESDILARVGGDEFVALTMESEDDSTQPLSERIERNLQAFQAREKPLYRLSFSLGAALYDPQTPVSLEELMYAADIKMYENKRRKQTGRRL